MHANNSQVSVTPRQLNVLKAIDSIQASQCYSPTIAEVAEKLNVSRSTVFEHVAALRRKRLLIGSRGRARSLKLTARASRLLDTEKSLQATNDALYDEAATGDQYCQAVGDDVNRSSGDIAGNGGVPLLGRVAAGIGIEAVENCEIISLDSVFGRSEDVFALEVEGDSMIDDGINSGDYVLCKKATSAHNGQTVVAIVDDNDATVKRFYDEGSQVRLQPANPAFEPIYTNNCRIEAIVLGLIRRL